MSSPEDSEIDEATWESSSDDYIMLDEEESGNESVDLKLGLECDAEARGDYQEPCIQVYLPEGNDEDPPFDFHQDSNQGMLLNQTTTPCILLPVLSS